VKILSRSRSNHLKAEGILKSPTVSAASGTDPPGHLTVAFHIHRPNLRTVHGIGVDLKHSRQVLLVDERAQPRTTDQKPVVIQGAPVEELIWSCEV